MEEDIFLNANKATIVARYCEAWNCGDLDAIFELFAQHARYEGTTSELNGRDAIRQMYERTFASREAKELVAKPIEACAAP